MLGLARRQQRILITNDLDFGALIVREGLPHRGVILFRLRSTNLATKQSRLAELLAKYSDRLDSFLTVTAARVRVTPAS